MASGERVAIVGAGVAGCAAAGALQDYGIDFVVFDKYDRPGGLWVNNYPNAQVQSTFELYEYPCKKFPPHIRNRKNPPAPTADEMCIYLEEYIVEKRMKSKFRFQTTVKSVLCTSENEWIIELDDYAVEYFTYVIICNGLVSIKPNKIKIPGMVHFQSTGGVVMHSSERTSDEMFRGKRVMVIGNGKSAVDAAVAASEVAKSMGTVPPIQLARRQTWYVPRYLLGVVQYKWAFHTRIGSALLPRYFETVSPMLIFLHCLFSPLKWVIWRVVELLLLLQYRLPYRIWPQLGTIERAALDTSVLITDERHLRRLRTGEVDMRIGKVERLEPGMVKFTNGAMERIDVIILATGWKLGFDVFMDSDSIFSGLDFSHDGLDFCEDGLWLYRNVLPCGFSGLAFVGSNTLTFMNIFTAYIQAYWLAQLLAGERLWPEDHHMKTTVQREKSFKRQYYPDCDMRGASIEAYMQHYHDVLFREMNAKKPFHCFIRPLADLFVPVLPSLMKGCLEPPQSQQQQQQIIHDVDEGKEKSAPIVEVPEADTEEGTEAAIEGAAAPAEVAIEVITKGTTKAATTVTTSTKINESDATTTESKGTKATYEEVWRVHQLDNEPEPEPFIDIEASSLEEKNNLSLSVAESFVVETSDEAVLEVSETVTEAGTTEAATTEVNTKETVIVTTRATTRKGTTENEAASSSSSTMNNTTSIKIEEDDEENDNTYVMDDIIQTSQQAVHKEPSSMRVHQLDDEHEHEHEIEPCIEIEASSLEEEEEKERKIPSLSVGESFIVEMTTEEEEEAVLEVSETVTETGTNTTEVATTTEVNTKETVLVTPTRATTTTTQGTTEKEAAASLSSSSSSTMNNTTSIKIVVVGEEEEDDDDDEEDDIMYDIIQTTQTSTS